MKFSLQEISLKELRDFVENTDKQSGFNLSELSLVSLKLRLQLIIKKNRIDDFQSFIKRYNENLEFKESIQNEIIPIPNEFFRDAEYWMKLIEEIKVILKNKAHIKIAICEPGKWADVISLILLLRENKIFDDCSITVFSMRKQYQTMNTSFEEKEIEMGQINFSTINVSKPLNSFFKLINKKYQFELKDNEELTIIPSFEKNIYSEETYDVFIARNITIAYNFITHEKIFSTYLNRISKGGILFAGAKESFKWCAGYLQLSSIEKSIPIYLKK